MKNTQDTKDLFDLIVENEEVGIIDKVYAENLKSRKIVINQEINDDIVEMATLQILKFNAMDKGKDVKDRQPIILYLSSNGGDVASGMTLIDAIQHSKTKVIGVLIGKAYSMMSYILMACHDRVAFPNSTILIHDGGFGVSNSSGKAKDAVRFYEKQDDNIKEFVLTTTKINSELYDSKLDREWYLFASEGKELGIVDKILGVDVDLDYII